jgi:hypothetical protein
MAANTSYNRKLVTAQREEAAHRGGLESSLSIEGRYAMEENNVVKLVKPGTFADGLTEVLRNGARKLLTQTRSQFSIAPWRRRQFRRRFDASPAG